MRLVLDTDVLLSALRSPSGASRIVVLATHFGAVRLVATPALLFEHEAVLKRPEDRAAFGLTPGEIDDFLGVILSGLRAAALRRDHAMVDPGIVALARAEDHMEAGYLGVGNMGQPMAEKLIDGGHQLTLFDINEAAMAPLLQRQARRANTPRELADRCETVFVSLPTLAAFRAVVNGPNGLAQGSRMKLLVNTCTIGVPFLREIEAALAPKGVAVVDCPISGGPAGARAGTLSVMVSGDPALIEKLRPFISLWGPTLTIAGDKTGAAQVLKLTNNILSAVALAATSEAFVMGAKGGLNPEVMLKAINAGSGQNSATQQLFPASVLDRSFHYGATLDVLIKDADLAIEQGEALGVPMWVCRAVRLVLKHTAFAGKGQDDVSTFVRVIEEGAGFQIPKTR